VTSAQSRYGGAKVRFPPPLVFLVLIALGVILQRTIRPVEVPLGFGLRVVAGSLLAFWGVVMVSLARKWFTRTGQNPAPWKPSPELIVKGIYRYTRNPMYVGVTLFQFGLGIALGNAWVALLASAGLVFIHFFAVRPEEAYLAEKFGESYRSYRATVRRYL
jgi:protein-S-isoprenylcysteine O-methyltransferase Ste14